MVEFVSQRSTKYSEFGCGIAAILMLLKTANISTPQTFIEMGNLLNVDIEPKDKWGEKFSEYGKGAYARDIAKYLDNNCINYICIADNKKSKISWTVLLNIIDNVPTMVGMINKNNPNEWGEGGHWVVLEKKSVNSFECYDPYKNKSDKERSYELNINQLKSDWDGFAIAIT